MNKKAIELSVNFLVVVIISMVMLSSGIILIKKFFGTAEDIKAQLDEQTISQIEELLDEGDIVAVPLNKKRIESGSAGIFGLGIMNIEEERKAFKVTITLSNAYKNDKSSIDMSQLPGEPVTWLLYDSVAFELDYRQKKTMPIRVSVPTGVVSGTYIFNVAVTANDAAYGITKIYVVVP